MSVLDDIKNGTNKPGTAQQSSSGLNIPANPPEESVQPKEMPVEAAKPVLNVPEAETPSNIPIQPQVKKPLSYGEIFRVLNPDPIPNEEDLKKEQKREKTRAFISALGDGISAISNMYSTTKGAVPVPDTPTLSERNTARYNDIVNRRLKKAEDRKQALTNSIYMDKQQDYREGRDKVEDQHYTDGLDYRDRQQQLSSAQHLADINYKNANLDFNARKSIAQHEETKRHNKALESIGTSKLNLEGERVAIAGRNEHRLEDTYGAGGSKRSKVRVVNAEGKLVNVDADIMSQADYWNYAKNALVQDGLLPNRAKVEDAKKFLNNRVAYEKSPKLRELREKVGSRLFHQQPAPVNKTQKPAQSAKDQHSNAKKTAQPAKKGSLLPH